MESKKIVACLIICLAALLVLDIVTTELVIEKGGSELNPIMKFIVSSSVGHALVKALFLTFCIVNALFCERYFMKKSSLIILSSATVFYTFVIINNTIVLISL